MSNTYYESSSASPLFYVSYICIVQCNTEDFKTKENQEKLWILTFVISRNFFFFKEVM